MNRTNNVDDIIMIKLIIEVSIIDLIHRLLLGGNFFLNPPFFTKNNQHGNKRIYAHSTAQSRIPEKKWILRRPIVLKL